MRPWRIPSGPFLEAVAHVRVRFQEVDSLGIAWHGHYLSFCEEGRLAFGRGYGLHYDDVKAAGLAVPIVHAALDYKSPARFDQELSVRTRLYPDPAARLLFRYWISDRQGATLAEAFTVQAFVDLEGTLQVARPPLWDAFLGRWESALRQEGDPA